MKGWVDLIAAAYRRCDTRRPNVLSVYNTLFSVLLVCLIIWSSSLGLDWISRFDHMDSFFGAFPKIHLRIWTDFDFFNYQ